jgi:hypothetical protein
VLIIIEGDKKFPAAGLDLPGNCTYIVWHSSGGSANKAFSTVKIVEISAELSEDVEDIT